MTEDLRALLLAAGVSTAELQEKPEWLCMNDHPALAKPSVLDALKSLAKCHADAPQLNSRSRANTKNKLAMLVEEYVRELQLLGHVLLRLLGSLKTAAIDPAKLEGKLPAKVSQHHREVIMRIGAASTILSAYTEASSTRAGLQQKQRDRSTSAAAARRSSSRAGQRSSSRANARAKVANSVDAPASSAKTGSNADASASLAKAASNVGAKASWEKAANSTDTQASLPERPPVQAACEAGASTFLLHRPPTKAASDVDARASLERPSHSHATSTITSSFAPPARVPDTSANKQNIGQSIEKATLDSGTSLDGRSSASAEGASMTAGMTTECIDKQSKDQVALCPSANRSEFQAYEMTTDASDAWEAVVAAIQNGDDLQTTWALEEVVDTLMAEEVIDIEEEDDGDDPDAGWSPTAEPSFVAVAR